MAARRLLIVMLILLGISSVIAIIVPERNRDDSPPAETAVTGETGATGNTGATGSTDADEPASGQSTDVLTESVDLDAKKPTEINAKAGSRMILTVKSKDGSLVEIDGLGLTGFADPYAPAVFDVILPPEAGKYRVMAPEVKPSAVITTN